ncbi:non-ribosomal peptide synthetase [Thermothelomyces heterothallicus CBS 202.75]|uniref:non-ribosomal peptide synthetase n=1 Tax=Thermothelomyces heterothallicus CBS 202.75 TaxID=1149848 RepID=UPI0037428835
MDTPTYPQTTNALSIINHPATRLEGPNLLHLLVQASSIDGLDAIDFLGADGRRTSLSYAELHHASELLALRISALARASGCPGPFVVPVLLPQSPELYIALLAILKAGGAFCPMNLDVPLNRAKFILEDVSAKIVVTTSELLPKLPQGEHSVLTVDRDDLDKSPSTVNHRELLPSDLAYVMYTSGSTGTPKGVSVSHDAVTQSLLAHDRHIPHFSRFLQFAAPTFDVSVFEIFFPLFRGKTLVSCSRSAMLNDLPGIIRSMDVDACELTPTVAGSLLRKRENAPCLRLLLTIGEMLTLPVVHEFGSKEGQPSMLWGMYGPTEAAIHCTLQPAFSGSSAVHNIGIPLDTVSAFVLKIPEQGEDARDIEIVPQGEIGELALGGFQLADGYLNRPEQTSSAFIDTPYGRLYRTGDKARMRTDGTLECLGRIKDGQVKLRGQRMELGEVEHAALRTPGCHSAVAAVTGATLVLFCGVDGDGGGDSTSAILESCRQWLPGYMVPGDIVLVQSFPRLPSGKVDRARLVADYAAQTAGTTQPVTYEDELERLLCELVGSCLGRKATPHQDLFKAGLDSLSAISLASVLRDAGFEVGALDLLEHRTISSIRKRVRSRTEAADLIPANLEPDISAVVPCHSALSVHGEPIEAIVPCTPLQASMLAETMNDPRAYCNWVELEFTGKLSIDTLRSWFSQLALGNEILRTGFIHHQGQFLQVIFEQLPQSSVSAVVDSTAREFQLRDEAEFLAPLRVQVPLSQSGEDTTVVLQLHHAIYDGWSFDLILSDLEILAQGQQLAPRPQFRHLSAYYHSAAFGRACDAAREFWAGNLLGFQPPPFPILGRETNRTPDVKSSTVLLDVGPRDLREMLQNIDCGPQAVFQAALAWLWGSIIGSDDVVIGSIHSGRTVPVPKIESIVGPCITAVPLRTDLSQVRTIRDLLVSVHAGNRATLPHGVLPLAEIKRAAGVRPGQSIYDVLFVYQESLPSRRRAVNVAKQVAHRDYLETKLLVEVEPRNKDFECRITYHSDAFPDPLVGVFQSVIPALVSHMLQNLEAEVSSLRASSPQHVLSVYNPYPTTFSGVPDLATAVERTAANFPDKDALCFADHISAGVLTTTTISFAELNKTANRIAWRLEQHRVREGQVVAIVMEKSISLYAGILAILKAGCAYLPLLPNTPVARIETIFQQADVEICLVDNATHDLLKQRLPCTLIDLQSLDLRDQTAPTLSARPPADPNRPAYIIYTSGSTGVPKGVCITQLNIMSNLDALSRIYPVKEDSRLLQSCSQAFDVSVFEIFFAWTRGMCLCSGTNDTLFEDLEGSIRKLKVTHLSMTPTVASLVDPDKVPLVEFLVTAGEPMTEAVARSWGDKLYQGYGPSETTNICSVKRMGHGQAIRHLGWSFENTSTIVLARDGSEVVPYGCLGELCFGGDQVAAGYLRMPELTAEKFISHPAYGRIYRSGDLGRMLPDGSIVIVGRADELIKIRGQRVELQEITEAIRQAGAADCATLLLGAEETGNRAQIVSFLVPDATEGSKFNVVDLDDTIRQDIQSLHHVLESRLPAYMLPSAIIPISVLPVTASGKLDRKRLEQAYRDFGKERLALVTHGPSQVETDGEWSSIETRIADVVSSALNVDRADVQRWTPLAVLGLDSISAIEVSRQLNKTLGKRVPISTILRNSSVARLAKALSDTDVGNLQLGEAPGPLPKDIADNVTTRLMYLGRSFSRLLPCTPLQQAMLATSSGNGQYLNRMLFRVNGDLEKLKDAWSSMIARHDILRTCFVETDDAKWPILQAVLASWQPSWIHLDASGSSLEDCMSEHALGVPNAIDSLEPAVSFATIVQADRVYLSLVCHHALYDGVAVERLLYEVERQFLGSTLPQTPSYDQFLRESLRLPASTDSFWLEHLRDYEPKLTAHLVAEPEPARTPTSLSSSELDMPLNEVKTRIKGLGVSLLALVQAAWATALGCMLKADDVCFGNVVNGRSLPIDGINELVAPCFNTIPIRMDLSSRQRNLELVGAFQALNTEMMEYQFTPLRRIQSLDPKNSGTRRLFDTLLLLQQSPRPLDESIWTLERDEGEMDVPLVCEVIPDEQLDRLIVRMHSDPSQSVPGEVAELACHLFLYAIRDCLQFPSSYVNRDNLPPGLAERLRQIEYRPTQSASAAAQERSTSEQWTTMEATVRSVLASLTSHASENIKHDTTIYQLGLDSISAVQIASQLRKRGYSKVTASDVLEHPTCAGLARYLDTSSSDMRPLATYNISRFQEHVKQQVLAHGIAAHTIEAVLPCTPLQSAMVAQFIKSEGRDYFNFVHFRLDDDRVNGATLAGAWHTVIRAHPILRTAIVSVEHEDSMFAMIQYRADMSEHMAVDIVRSSSDKLDLNGWRLDASRAALRHPHTRLWSVIVVDGGAGVEMHLAIHHALYDAQSLQAILDDLSKAASNVMGIVEGPSIEEAVTDILGQVSANRDHSADFWKRQAKEVVINRFPILTPLQETERRMLTESVMSTTRLTDLEEAASRSGHTLQVVLQAAWTRVLSAYLGEDSVVFGVVLSGRNTDATRDAVFPCVSTLPVIATNTNSNEALLAQMLRYGTELYRQQHQPLTRIQQWLGRPDSKLFDTLLVYQKSARVASAEHPWRVVDESANVEYPVSVEVESGHDCHLAYRATFPSDVLASEQALLLLRQLDAAVQHLAFQPLAQETDLFRTHPDLFSILPPEMPEIPTEVRFLHQFVERQALQAPDTTALHFVERFDGDAPVGRRWTYKELNDNGDRVAHMVLPHAEPGGIVAVYFDKCPEAYFSILGILKAGCAFVALDPTAPRARNEFILRDSGASALITSSALRDHADFADTLPTLVVDQQLSLSSSSAAAAGPPLLRRELRPNDVCYCLYTSGTTGTPKGCEITHDNAVQCMLAFQHIFRGHWQADSRWLQFASLHFDVSVLEQYWSWSVGITLVAAPRDLILEDLAGTISRLEVTHIDLTPSLARLLRPDDVPSLCRGVFITGGEALKQEILDAWGSERVIYNFYGPTEATIGVTAFPRVPANGRASNIGRQFINVGSYVLKPGTQHPVLRGGVGELCVSGRLVGRGYLGREDLTAERFPILGHFGERVYRTGDLVRLLHDGCFDFLGRADDQVKLRGQRLEIGEINHAIRKGVEEVRDVATLVVRSEAQQHKDVLVSFIATDSGRAARKDGRAVLEVSVRPEAVELCRRARDACRSKLPGYMVPTYILQVPFIPLSANNKAELRQLRQLFASLKPETLVQSLSSSRGVSNRTLGAAGERVARVIAAMQKVDASVITPGTSIFELGIDSITVLRLSRALKSEGLAQASPALILKHPLLADLVAALEAQHHPNPVDVSQSVANARQLVQACAHKHRASVCRELGVTPDQVEYIAPCSPLQQGMISRTAMDAAYYFNSFEFVLSPKVSTTHLRDALQRTVDALPILRTKFVGTADGVVQVAVNRYPLPWADVLLEAGASLTNAVRESRGAWIERNRKGLHQPLEAALITSAGGARLLVLHVFHALYDANSINFVLDRAIAEYRTLNGELAASTNGAAPAPSFLEALCHGPLRDFGNTKSFWLEHLEGVTPIPPSDITPPHSSVTSHQQRVPFGPLELLRTRVGVTHQALVQAAWVAVLAKHRSADPTIGVIVSGRSMDLDGAETVVGPLFNTLPFHARVIKSEAGSTWASLVRQCHEYNTAVLPFQHVPLRDIQKWCSGGRPLFDTLFSFQLEEHTLAEHGEDLWTAKDSEPNADYPLALEATMGADGHLRLLIVAQAEKDRVLALMGDLEQALEAMVENPDGLVLQSGSHDSITTEAAAGGTLAARAGNDVLVNGNNNNNNHAAPPAAESSFTWSKEALTIRNEIASLAGTDPESVTETTPLFGLGLDSIDIIKLAAVLRKQEMELKTSELMKAQTIATIAEILQARRHQHHIGQNGIKDASDVDVDELSRLAAILRQHIVDKGAELAADDVVLPATPLQETMLAEMVESDFELYFNHDILEIAPCVDIAKLKNAWTTVIGGSPILRTRFLQVESPCLNASYCQVVSSASSTYYMTEVSLNSPDELAKVCQTATLRARKGAGRSDLLQLAFASVAGQKRYLVLSIAHALYDGWSLSLLHRHVHEAYHGTYQPQDTTSYVNQLRDVLLPQHRDAPSFWSGFLQGARPTMFPEEEGSPDQAHHPIYRDEAASSVQVSEIAAFCKANAITMHTLGQACWSALLAAKTASMDVTFGVVLSCRDDETLERFLFPTMNTVAVRTVLHGTVASWLRYMQENMGNIASYQHFPLREAQRLARSNGPLFNTLFIQQRGLPGHVIDEQGSGPLLRSVGGTLAVEYPVCVEMEVTADSGLIWRIACDGAFASRNETSRILRDLDELLGRMMRSPEASVLEFSGEQVSICGQPPVVLQARESNISEGSSSSSSSSAAAAAAAHEAVNSGDPSWSSTEETIRRVLAEVSGVPAATILKSNNIYHLGLDSISAIKAVSLLRKSGLKIGLRDMLKAGSISRMAQCAREAGSAPVGSARTSDGNGPRTEVVTVPPGFDLDAALAGIGMSTPMVEDVLPATPMQVHMLSAWQNTRGAVFYPCFRYTISGHADAHTIARAWKVLTAETPALRTIFLSTESRATPVLQVILRPSTADQGDGPSPADGNNSWSSRAAEHPRQPYNSLHAEKQGEKWLLRLRIHHALYDAVSLSAIMDRFAALCGAQDLENESVRRPVPGRRDSVPSFRCSSSSPSSAAEDQTTRRQFWTAYLANAPSRPLLAPQEEVPEEPPSRARGVSFQALFFAAYAEFLASAAAAESGSPRPETVVFGIYLANRAGGHDGPGASVYPFLRLVPLRVAPRPGPGLLEVAAEVQADIHAISSPVNVEVALWEIKDWTGVTIDSFVNFLASSPLPASSGDTEGEAKNENEKEEEEEEEEEERKGKEVRWELVGEPAADDAVVVENLKGDGFNGDIARELSSNPVRDAFPDAIDVEVSLQDNEMTIGVFGPGQRLRGVDGAAKILEGIVEVLTGVL